MVSILFFVVFFFRVDLTSLITFTNVIYILLGKYCQGSTFQTLILVILFPNFKKIEFLVLKYRGDICFFFLLKSGTLSQDYIYFKDLNFKQVIMF